MKRMLGRITPSGFAENQLTGFGQNYFAGLYEELAQLDEKIPAHQSSAARGWQQSKSAVAGISRFR